MKHADFKTLLNHGSSALLSPYAQYALMLNFVKNEYWANGAQAANLAAIPGYSYTRTGIQGVVNADGSVSSFAADVPAINANGHNSYKTLTNLLLNAGQSSALITQSVTVTAAAHTLAFIGTGSVALSGAATGTLVGTGANSQVNLIFTPAAGSLTLTVTGDVRFAGLMLSTINLPVPVIATAGATAAIGAGNLSTSMILPAGDFIIFAEVRSLVTTLINNGAFDASSLTTFWNERIYISTVSGGYSTSFRTTVGGGIVSSAAIPGTTDGNNLVFFRKVGGTFKSGYVNSGGVVTLGTDVVSPTPISNKFTSGSAYDGTNGANGLILQCGVKAGTFDTDAKILALRTELAA